MQSLFQGDAQLHPTLTPRKLSDSPLTDHSENGQYASPNIILHFPDSQDLRLHLYQSIQEERSISEQVNRKGISWLYTISLGKGYSDVCIWNSILLFYAYKAHFSFRREKMEAILLVCLQLSSKIYESNWLRMREVLMLAGHPLSRDEILNYQKQILEMADFNLIVPHYFTYLYHLPDPDAKSKSLFLCELLTLQSHHIFFESDEIQKIVRLATHTHEEGDEKEASGIKEVLGSKQAKILMNRYESEFDVQLFAELFNVAH